MRLSLDTDNARNRGLFLPFEDGLPHVDHVMPLPVELLGEGIVVVSGVTTSKKDAPFTVSLEPSAAAPDLPPNQAGGCSLAGSANARHLPEPFTLLLALLAASSLRANRARRASSARAAVAVDTPSP